MASAQMAGDGRPSSRRRRSCARSSPTRSRRASRWCIRSRPPPTSLTPQFSTPETILAPPDPGDEIPYVKAMWHYARGVALAAQGKFVEADLEATAIEAIEGTADFTLLKASGIPAHDPTPSRRTGITGGARLEAR